MDKQKQIEEMAKIIRSAKIQCREKDCGECKYVNKSGSICDSLFTADILSNVGYRKIPENEVVIEKSEYEKLRLLADECLDWRRKNCNVAELPKENSVVLTKEAYSDLLSDEVDTIERDIAEYWAMQDVKSVAKELHKEGYRKLDDHAIFVLRKAKGLEENVRKETAEKFAERLKDALFDLGNVVTEKDIDKICKEITEGKV